MAYKTEFTSYAVKIGKEAKAEEWMRILHERQSECVETLEREQMHYECIFRGFRKGRMYLSWFSIQSARGLPVENSPHPIDQLHIAYWDECIDDTVAPENLDHVVTFAPASIEDAVVARDEQECP